MLKYVYDFRTIFTEVTNDDDFKTVWFKRSIDVDGLVMWLQKWMPDFKPEEDSPIAPIWVLLSGLPFHCYTWHYVKQILGPVGLPLSMDIATDYRTRPSMAKVRVEVDLTKPQLKYVWVGQENETNPLKGFMQKLEYEGVPKYCKHCRRLGHSIIQHRVVEKEKEEKLQEATKTKAIMPDNKNITGETNKEENTEAQKENQPNNMLDEGTSISRPTK